MSTDSWGQCHSCTEPFWCGKINCGWIRLSQCHTTKNFKKRWRVWYSRLCSKSSISKFSRIDLVLDVYKRRGEDKTRVWRKTKGIKKRHVQLSIMACIRLTLPCTALFSCYCENWIAFLSWFGVFRPTREFLLILRSHHYQWKSANYDLWAALMDIEQWGFFSVLYLQWHGTSAYNGYPDATT